MKQISAVALGMGPIMRACMAAALLLAGGPVSASEDLRATLTPEDHSLLNRARSEYNGCLQERLPGHLDQHDDVRLVAADTVDDCSAVITDLDRQLARNGIDPDYYRGIIERIKSRAIRRILPAIMMYKAQAAGAATEE